MKFLLAIPFHQVIDLFTSLNGSFHGIRARLCQSTCNISLFTCQANWVQSWHAHMCLPVYMQQSNSDRAIRDLHWSLRTNLTLSQLKSQCHSPTYLLEAEFMTSAFSLEDKEKFKTSNSKPTAIQWNKAADMSGFNNMWVINSSVLDVKLGSLKKNNNSQTHNLFTNLKDLLQVLTVICYELHCHWPH